MGAFRIFSKIRDLLDMGSVADQGVMVFDLATGKFNATTPMTGVDFNQVVECTYSSAGDTNGIFYKIATRYGDQTWVNPALMAVDPVIFTSSGDDAATDPISTLVDREVSNYSTLINSGNWIQVDLGAKRSLLLKKYLLRGSAYSNNVPQYWIFQGSNDGSSWTTVHTHLFNSSEFPPNSVNVYLDFTPDVMTTSYRYFRITMTNPGYHGYNILRLGEMELYGTLSLTGASIGRFFGAPSDQQGTQVFRRIAEADIPVLTRYIGRDEYSDIAYTYVSDGDTNGVLYGIGTDFGSRPWVNPVFLDTNPVSFSGVTLISGTLSSLSDRTLSEVVVNGIPKYYQLDLGVNKALFPTKFTLRSGSYNGVRDWEVQGSVDGVSWRRLYYNTNTALYADQSYYTATADNIAPVPVPYRYFRFIGYTSRFDNYTFYLSEIELYGTLRVYGLLKRKFLASPANEKIGPPEFRNIAIADLPSPLNTSIVPLGMGLKTVEKTWVSDGDTNGVFYALGQQLISESWQNPYTLGMLGIAISGELGGSYGTRDVLVDRFPSHWHSTAVASSYVQFDLGPARSLVIKRYTYQTRDDSTTARTVTWKLEGSNDTTTWVQVDSQTNFTWTAQGSWASIAIAGQVTGYRYWKLTQTAVNSSGALHLTVGELELYGTFSYGGVEAKKFWAGPAAGSPAAASMRSIASTDLPPGTGLPAGGSTGQVATKASGSDWDVVWATPTSGPSASFVTKTATFNFSAGDKIAADTSSSAFTGTLPLTPTAGDVIEVIDPKGTWATNNFTVNGNGKLVGGADTFVSDVSGFNMKFVYIDPTVGWKVYFLQVSSEVSASYYDVLTIRNLVLTGYL